jgi:hypothetical protein
MKLAEVSAKSTNLEVCSDTRVSVTDGRPAYQKDLTATNWQKVILSRIGHNACFFGREKTVTTPAEQLGSSCKNNAKALEILADEIVK